MRRRRQGILFVAITAAAFFIADTINAFLQRSLVVPLDALPAAAAARPPAAPATDAGMLVQEIVSSGLFPPAPASAERDAGAPDGAPVPAIDAAKTVKLMGTVLGEGLSALAVLQHLATQRQTLYHLHEQVPEVGEISEIRANGVVIQQGGRQELLELTVPKVARPIEVTTTQRPGDGAGRGIPVSSPPTQTSDGRPIRGVLERREVAAATANLATLQAQARIEPAYTEGKLDGWRVAAYRPQSLFDKVGLQAGDVLQQVNGVPIRDLNTLGTLFQQLKDERNMSVNLLRNGQPVTLSYEIR